MSNKTTHHSPLSTHQEVSDIAIRVSNLSKCYQIYDNPRDRLKQFVVPKLCRAFPPLRKVFPTPHSPLPTPHSLLTIKTSGRSKPYRSKSKKAKPSASLAGGSVEIVDIRTLVNGKFGMTNLGML